MGGGAQHRSQQCPQSCQLYSDSACLTGVPFKGLRYLIYGETSSGCYVGHYGIYLSALLLRHAAARRLCNTNVPQMHVMTRTRPFSRAFYLFCFMVLLLSAFQISSHGDGSFTRCVLSGLMNLAVQLSLTTRSDIYLCACTQSGTRSNICDSGQTPVKS